MQQNFQFATASPALSTLLEDDYLHVRWACAIALIAARRVFWIGYRIHPPYALSLVHELLRVPWRSDLGLMAGNFEYPLTSHS